MLIIPNWMFLWSIVCVLDRREARQDSVHYSRDNRHDGGWYAADHVVWRHADGRSTHHYGFRKPVEYGECFSMSSGDHVAYVKSRADCTVDGYECR